MSAASPEPPVFPLGPGTLTIGATGTPIDVSCLVNNAVISADKEEGDSTTKLCGTVRPGSVTYTYTLAGNMDTDVADEAGIFALSQSAPGTEQDFTFTPNTDAGTTATGRLVIDPLDFGGDTTGETMTSDFEFTVVGAPAYTFAPDLPLADDTATTTSSGRRSKSSEAA
jgi:hypothetical protein